MKHCLGARRAILALAGPLAAAWIGLACPAMAGDAGPAFREPVTLTSRDGVLEVRLTAHQGHARLDTVAAPVGNALLYAYEVIRGSASDGRLSADDPYPAPTLQVFPGDRLIVHMENALAGLTIRDYYDPAFSAMDAAVPLYPPALTQAPVNLHTHGLRVSPKGNADNVLLHIGAGLSNSYVYDIRADHPQGAYWYHPHLHGLTAQQVYLGLAGVLAVGRLDGNLPLATAHRLPIRNMALQYNYVFDRKGGGARLNNANWPQYVSTLVPPQGDALASGRYRPLLAPVDFDRAAPGTRHATVWHAGPLSIYNSRGRFQFIPANLQAFAAGPGGEGQDSPADPSLPDRQRDVQFTVNGQFQPVIDSRPGQTEIWVLSNISDMAYIPVQLTETATGLHPRIAIVGQDGNAGPAVRHPLEDDGRRLLIPPASRFAIAVTMPEEGELVLEMPPQGPGARAVSEPGILYTANGTGSPPAVLGSLTVLPAAISYDDGFFLFPTQVLARAVPSGPRGTSVPFVAGQALDAPGAPFRDLSQVQPAVVRTLDVTGGFLDDLASPNDPKAFIYAFNDRAFPNPPLLQPRLGSVEEWRFRNFNNDEHPIHIHVNDFQVVRDADPTTGSDPGPARWATDNANLARPALMSTASQDVAQPGLLSIRSRFEDYLGTFVMHCHRLNHEDNGLMALVNIIPAVSSYAVVRPGAPGRPAAVEISDGEGDRLLAIVTPFPDDEGMPAAAMGDVDGDGIYDLVVGAGAGHAPEVAVYAGAARGGSAAFATELARFAAFPAQAIGGISVAAAQVDGSTVDNILVGSPPGLPSQVKVFAHRAGAAPALVQAFAPFAGDFTGVQVAAGFVSFMSGRNSILAAPGPGGPARVRVFDYWLMTPLALQIQESNLPLELCSASNGGPSMIAELAPFGEGYRGGVSLATGWLYGELGGARRIVVGQADAPGRVKVYSSGSELEGGPELYLRSPVDHGALPAFREVLDFAPFAGAAGVRVATTSTTAGADLLVGGIAAPGAAAEVRRYRLARPAAPGPDARAGLEAVPLGTVATATGTAPPALGGD